MKEPLLLLAIAVGVIVSLGTAQTQTSVALTGQVMSAEEGSMEGVLVSVKRVDSTITTTVVSDEQGRYRFPSAKLQPGRYSVRIRAVGYDLDAPRAVDVTKDATATADLKLTKA